jgi:hypothetical protein
LTQIPTSTTLAWVQSDSPSSSNQQSYVLWLEDGYWQICQAVVPGQVIANFLTATKQSSIDVYRTNMNYSVNTSGNTITLTDTPTNTTLSFAYAPQEYYTAASIFKTNEANMQAISTICKNCNAMVGTNEAQQLGAALQALVAFMTSRVCKCPNS